MNWLNKLRKLRWAIRGRQKIKKLVLQKHQNGEAIKIILGAGHHSPMDGEWINTDLPQFDVTNADHWSFIFGELKIDNLLAEHVFEHLTLEQNKIAFTFIYKYLKPNGVFRFAVPDGNHTDKNYINYVKPNGNGPGCDDHKLLWTIDLIQATFSDSKFKIIPKEYYTKEGELVCNVFSAAEGNIIRTVSSNNKQDWKIKNYSSLIVDFVKV